MSASVRQIRIVGAGLLGTSIGLALSKLGVDVAITSASEASVALAVKYGAGRKATAGDDPQLIVVCVPPNVTAELVAREIESFPNAVVTDVASVKGSVFEQLEKLGISLANFVGSHPMAGRERGGAASGRADLFVARPWVIVPHATSSPKSVALVTAFAKDLQSIVIELSAHEHDRAVAAVSHLPQVVSSLLAGELVEVATADLSLAGAGLRDTTRIAASDAHLWSQILSANSKELLPLLQSISKNLIGLISGLAEPTTAASAAIEVIEAGNAGVDRIPGKHGGAPKHFATVTVMVADRAGELAHLLTEIGQIGINLEDLKLEHSPGAPIGLAEVSVLPELEAKLIEELVSRGWAIA